MNRIATIEHSKSADSYFVSVMAKMIEGHWQCVSHAPFSPQPNFSSLEQAEAFARSRGAEQITHQEAA